MMEPASADQVSVAEDATSVRLTIGVIRTSSAILATATTLVQRANNATETPECASATRASVARNATNVTEATSEPRRAAALAASASTTGI